MKTEKGWLERNGFNEDGITYGIYGGNTYEIKDYLKEQGCKYSPLFKWHCAYPDTLDLPDEYKFVAFDYRDYMIWDNRDGMMINFADAEEKTNAVYNSFKEPSKSQYLDGEIGDKIVNLPVVLKSMRGFQSKFGWSNVLTFMNDDNIITWFTSTEPDIEVGESYLLSGTIKDFQEYKGEKQTVLKRCKVS